MGSQLRFSPRQKQLLDCLCRGMVVKEAAEEMGITYGTAKQYMEHIRNRFHSKSVYQMISIYIRYIVQQEFESINGNSNRSADKNTEFFQ